ncbi:hypothetical protein D3C76_1438000 [compost metagenome]
MPENRSLSHSGFLGDFTGGGRSVSLLGEYLHGGLHDSELLFGHFFVAHFDDFLDPLIDGLHGFLLRHNLIPPANDYCYLILT